MTRKKKTRSLKRIHNVKTGSVAKLKREGGANRQSSKRIKKKTQSVFDKFLDENPAAKKKVIQDELKAAEQKAVQADKATETVTERPEPKEREKTLLEQLESKDFNDIY